MFLVAVIAILAVAYFTVYRCELQEAILGAISDAVSVLSGKIDDATASEVSEIARVEALIASLQANPDDPAVVAQIVDLQAKADALKSALDAERP